MVLKRFLQLTFLMMYKMEKNKFSGVINCRELIFNEPLFSVRIEVSQSDSTNTTISYCKANDARIYYLTIPGVWCIKCAFHRHVRREAKTETYIYIVEMWSFEDLILYLGDDNNKLYFL